MCECCINTADEEEPQEESTVEVESVEDEPVKA
jgi:hypothetical protein